MGKTSGFLDWKRQMPARRGARLRVLDWREIYLDRSSQQAREQGGRCMDCGVPFCQQGCPLGNQIPTWNDHVYRDRWRAAYHALESTNNFPEFTGRLCPAPCETACVLSLNDDPVTIEHTEKEIIERAFEEGWVQPHLPKRATGKRVAVVGSGPAGLAAAQQLTRAGHDVTVYERDEGLGGLLRYGIPDFKMEKWVLERRLDLMRAEGTRFETGVDVGDDVTWAQLRGESDALVVAIGAQRPRDLDIDGRELEGVHLAMDYLTQQNRTLAAQPGTDAQQTIDARGKRVVILGGGDTGSDCLGTAHRQGASWVAQIELMPAPPETRMPANPWPQWPIVMRTSCSQQEGGDRRFALLTKRLSGHGGKLDKLHAVGVEARPVAGGGVRFEEQPGDPVTIDVDLLIVALGFMGPMAKSLVDELGVDLDARGNIVVDDRFRTTVPGVYSAGDSNRGASLIVWAISDGREAARTVDSDLMRAKPRLPTRGMDRAFGGR